MNRPFEWVAPSGVVNQLESVVTAEIRQRAFSTRLWYQDLEAPVFMGWRTGSKAFEVLKRSRSLARDERLTAFMKGCSEAI